MKLDIDLTEIFEDETGENIRLTFSDRIAESVANRVMKNSYDRIDRALQKALDEQVKTKITEKLEVVLESLLDFEYEPTGRYGEKTQKTTIRNEIAKTLQDNIKFEKHDSWSDKKDTPLAKIVTKVIEQTIEPFKKEIRDLLTSKFKQEVIGEAYARLKKEFDK